MTSHEKMGEIAFAIDRDKALHHYTEALRIARDLANRGRLLSVDINKPSELVDRVQQLQHRIGN
jgi:hypothetical protein